MSGGPFVITLVLQDVRHLSGLLNAARQVGATVGVAAMGAVLATARRAWALAVSGAVCLLGAVAAAVTTRVS